MDKIEEEIIKAITQIAYPKIPENLIEYYHKELWMSGFIKGYLTRTTEEIINKNNLKTKN